jgi:hypothetical protein
VLSLPCEHATAINLEHSDPLEAWNPVGPAIETGPKNDQLLGISPESFSRHIVDDARAGDPRRSRPGLSTINVSRHASAQPRQPCQQCGETKRRPQETMGERIVN